MSLSKTFNNFTLIFTLVAFIFSSAPARLESRALKRNQNRKNAATLRKQDVSYTTFDLNSDGRTDAFLSSDDITEVRGFGLIQGIYRYVKSNVRINDGFLNSHYVYSEFTNKYVLIKQSLIPFRRHFHANAADCALVQTSFQMLSSVVRNNSRNSSRAADEEGRKDWGGNVDQNTCDKGEFTNTDDLVAEALNSLYWQLENAYSPTGIRDSNTRTAYQCLSKSYDPITAYKLKKNIRRLAKPRTGGNGNIARDQNGTTSPLGIRCERLPTCLVPGGTDCESSPPTRFASYSDANKVITLHLPPTGFSNSSNAAATREEKVASLMNYLSHELIHASGVGDETTTRAAVSCCFMSEQKNASTSDNQAGQKCEGMATVDSTGADRLKDFADDPLVMGLVVKAAETKNDDEMDELLSKLGTAKTALLTDLAPSCYPSQTPLNPKECTGKLTNALTKYYESVFSNCPATQDTIPTPDRARCGAVKENLSRMIPDLVRACISADAVARANNRPEVTCSLVGITGEYASSQIASSENAQQFRGATDYVTRETNETIDTAPVTDSPGAVTNVGAVINPRDTAPARAEAANLGREPSAIVGSARSAALWARESISSPVASNPRGSSRSPARAAQRTPRDGTQASIEPPKLLGIPVSVANAAFQAAVPRANATEGISGITISGGRSTRAEGSAGGSDVTSRSRRVVSETTETIRRSSSSSSSSSGGSGGGSSGGPASINGGKPRSLANGTLDTYTPKQAMTDALTSFKAVEPILSSPARRDVLVRALNDAKMELIPPRGGLSIGSKRPTKQIIYDLDNLTAAPRVLPVSGE